MRNPLRSNASRTLVSQILVIVALGVISFLVGAVAVLIAGESPVQAYLELFRGAFGTRSNFAATVARSIPIIVTGVGAAVAFKAGFFNLGVEGQMVMGALASAVVADWLRAWPPVVLFPVVVLSGCLAGGLWALPSAWWESRLKVPLLLTTLLMNYVANLFASYLANFPLRDLSGGAAVPQTRMIPDGIHLGVALSGTRLHWGFIVLLVLPFAAYWLLRRTVLGYGMRMSGYNPRFAEYGGINMHAMILITMFISGAIGGLAGTIHTLGVDFRFIDGAIVRSGHAWDGFIAALLALAEPIPILGTGFFLAVLEVGAAGMQRNTNVPLQLADVVQAVIIFMIAVRLKFFDLIRQAVERLGQEPETA